MRRSIYSSKDIIKNSEINFKNIKLVRPFVSLTPLDVKKVIGKKIKKNLDNNTPIVLNILKK